MTEIARADDVANSVIPAGLADIEACNADKRALRNMGKD